MVPVAFDRLVVLPSLPEPRGDDHRLRIASDGRGQPDDVRLVPLPADRALADPRLHRSSAARLGALARSNRGRRRAAAREQTGLRLRAWELHLAGVRGLLAALGDVAA